MRLPEWQALLETHKEAHALIERAAHEELDALHERLRRLLLRLSSRLERSLSKSEVKQVLFVLVIQLDERVQRRLQPDQAPRWPLLQRALFNIHHGGELVYELIDARLARVDTPPLLFELLYFCLSDGFVGRHSRRPQAIEDYKRKLAARIAAPRAHTSAEATTAYESPTRFPARYYVCTAAFVALLPFVLFALSR